MKRLRMAVVLLLCVCLTACTAQPSGPVAVDETVERIGGQLGCGGSGQVYTYEELVAASQMIVVADVMETTRDDGFVKAICRPAEVLKGHVGEEFAVCDSGGFRTADYEAAGSPSDLNVMRREYTFVGEPLMRSGNRVLLFMVDKGKVSENGLRYFELAIGPASKFFFDPEDDVYRNSLLYGEIYVEYANANHPWNFVENVLSDMEPKTLEDIKSCIGVGG
ncbi:MAG: hypothetical protein IJB27_05430 [Clostridia bacterium]|nr:hypothetical protein [Clostridia bacterium]